MGAALGCCSNKDRDCEGSNGPPKLPPLSFRYTTEVLRRVGGLHLLPNNTGKIPDDKYIIGHKLGKGGFAEVRRATPREGHGQLACKTIEKGGIACVEAFVDEVEIHASADHPNISKLFETFEDASCVHLILELCHGGELFIQILSLGSFRESDASAIWIQALRGVAYLHAQDIAHRDLKPENFLLAEKVSRYSKLSDNTLKIIDFGFAKRLKRDGEGQSDPMCTKVGSPQYVSPQVIQGRYSEKCDVWSLGVTLYMLLSGVPPFQGQTDTEILNQVATKPLQCSGSAFKNVSEEARQFTIQLLDRDERRRPGAQSALCDPWLTQTKKLVAEPTPLGKTLLQRLRNFARLCHFKRAALRLIVKQIDDVKLKALREKFTRLDKSGNGTLSPEELFVHCASLGVDEEHARAIFKQLDQGNRGAISWSDFVTALVTSEQYLQRETCEAAFRTIDKSGNGTICLEDFKVMFSNEQDGVSSKCVHGMPEDQVEEMFRDADTNNDGTLSYDEFVAVLRRQCSDD